MWVHKGLAILAQHRAPLNGHCTTELTPRAADADPGSPSSMTIFSAQDRHPTGLNPMHLLLNTLHATPSQSGLPGELTLKEPGRFVHETDGNAYPVFQNEPKGIKEVIECAKY